MVSRIGNGQDEDQENRLQQKDLCQDAAPLVRFPRPTHANPPLLLGWNRRYKNI
jgi:hypothetical protein